jgi:hypothetical protein
MAGLDLVPNSVVGYRIRAEWLNWVVVLVKRHGEHSRAAGQEYDTAVGYYKNLEQAAQAVLRLETARLAGLAQAQALAEHGTLAETRALLEALPQAQAALERALDDVRRRLDTLGPADEAAARRRLAADERGGEAAREAAVQPSGEAEPSEDEAA